MPPRRSQRIAVTSSTSQPTRSVDSEPVPTAAPITKPAAKRRRIATPTKDEEEEEEEEEEGDYDDGDEDGGEYGDGETEDEAPPAPKRKQKRPTKGKALRTDPRSQWKHVRGRRGILQKMTDTPLDVLFEIFSYLDPLDLLRISRTTKDLRQLLMSKSSAFVWERARLATEGLPPLPDDLNDPQYINLLFDKHCHECGDGVTQSAQWEARLRLCKNCLQSNKIMTANLGDLVLVSGRYLDLIAITPKYILVTPSGRYSSRRTTYYHLATYKRLAVESAKVSDFGAWHTTKLREYTALAASCKPYERWLTTKKQDRTVELAALRNQRISSILERLKADGWTEELKDSDALNTVQSHKLVNQAKALTDRIWNNIEPTLTALMTNIRDELLAKKIRTAVPRRIRLVTDLCKPVLSAMPEIPVIPDPSLIPHLQPFLDIIKNTPYDEDLTDDDFADAVTALPEICTSWRQQQEDDLKSKLSALGRDVDLSLAANAFACANCSSHYALHYPYFASHGCFIANSYIDGMPVTSWNYARIKAVDEEARKSCEEIIRSCDLDPATATAQDMDDADVFFQCEVCRTKQWQPPGSKVSYLMRWRAAMNHAHLGYLQRVTDLEFITLAKAKEQSSFRLEINAAWFRAYSFVCNHCGMADITPYPEDRVEHLRTAHGITGGIENHYRRSAKKPPLSDGHRIEVAAPVPTPADTTIATSSTADGTADTLSPTATDATSVGDALLGEGEAENPGLQNMSSSSSAYVDSGTEDSDFVDSHFE